MKRRRYLKALFYAVLWFALSCGKVLFGQTVYSPSQLLLPLNDTGGSARAMAMGSAFVGVADDSSALLWNPAGLADLPRGDLALHHNSWLVGTDEESVVAGFPLDSTEGIGAMLDYMGYGTFQGRDENGALTTPYSVNHYGFMVGWGKQLDQGFSTGLALRGDLQAGPEGSYGTLSGDLGLLFYSMDKRINVGAAVIDFGGNQDGALVATTIEAGASFRQSLGKSQDLLLALSGTLEPQGVNRIGIGAEYSLQSRYFLRAGYQLSDQNNEIDGFQGFTAGAGIRMWGFQLDYAFLPYGDLGTSHRVSLSYLFPSPTGTPKASPNQHIETPQPSSPPVTFKPNPGTEPNQKVLTLQFNVPGDLVAQGQSLDAKGQRVEAMRLYEEEIKDDGQDAAAWYYLGGDYYKLSQKVYAVQCFEKVRALRPEDKNFSDWLEKYKKSMP